MIIGIPKEIKIKENRVAGTPDSVRALIQAKQTVLVETQAGLGSGFTDGEYKAAGATLCSSAAEVFQKSELIWKVKEPQHSEILHFRKGQLLFTYLHLASAPELAKNLCAAGITGIAYETVELADGSVPLLAPMSETAGKLGTMIGANYLRKDLGGKGVLLPGVGLSPRGKVTILGVGNAGWHALVMAHGMGADVTVIDKNGEKLKKVQQAFPERTKTLSSTSENIAAAVKETDLLIGAVYVTGKAPPKLVTEAMVKSMQPGSVIVDIAIDQGGCVETIRPTTLQDPVYSLHGVTHYAVTNMPAQAPRSATQALTAATLPYLLKIAQLGLDAAVSQDPALEKGINILNGKLIRGV